MSRSGDDLDLSGALGIACDVRNSEDVQRAVDATVERFGRLDIVIANAGVGSYGPFLDLALDDIEEMIDVNLKDEIGMRVHVAAVASRTRERAEA